MPIWQKVQDPIKQSEEQQTRKEELTEEEKEKRDKSNSLQWLLILNKACHFLISKLCYIQKSGITFLYYSASLLYSVFLVILIFSFQNLALFKIDPVNFSSQPKGGFIFFFYYSFNTLFNRNIADFYPYSSFARLFSMGEVLFGFLILVILFYLLFTIVREKHKKEIQTSIIELEKQGSKLEKLINKEFHLSIDQAIDEVEKVKGSMLKVIYYFMSNTN